LRMSGFVFHDRRAAARSLAEGLAAWRGRPDTLVLGLPRGGAVVAEEVSRALSLPWDVWIVRKLGLPRHPETAFGAIASGGVRVFQREAAEAMLSAEEIREVLERESAELSRREKMYRGNDPPPVLRGKNILLVDDGAATGSTMQAAVEAARRFGASFITAAVPVASPEAFRLLRLSANRALALLAPRDFSAVGQFYGDFSPVEDREVCSALARRQGHAHAL
jgi:putative phosphoribosyl transferase